MSSSGSSEARLISGREETSKEKWLEKINSVQIPRAEVNKLIMNYLVSNKIQITLQICVCLTVKLPVFRSRKDSRMLLKSSRLVENSIP